jgi:hypothetical protein
MLDVEDKVGVKRDTVPVLAYSLVEKVDSNQIISELSLKLKTNTQHLRETQK